jgi:hypothetical protein
MNIFPTSCTFIRTVYKPITVDTHRIMSVVVPHPDSARGRLEAFSRSFLNLMEWLKSVADDTTEYFERTRDGDVSDELLLEPGPPAINSQALNALIDRKQASLHKDLPDLRRSWDLLQIAMSPSASSSLTSHVFHVVILPICSSCEPSLVSLHLQFSIATSYWTSRDIDPDRRSLLFLALMVPLTSLLASSLTYAHPLDLAQTYRR